MDKLRKYSAFRRLSYKHRIEKMTPLSEEEVINLFFSFEIWYVLDWRKDIEVLKKVVEKAMEKGFDYITHMVLYRNPELLDVYHKDEFTDIVDTTIRVQKIYPDSVHHILASTSMNSRRVMISDEMCDRLRTLKKAGDRSGHNRQMKAIMGDMDLSDLCDEFEENAVSYLLDIDDMQEIEDVYETIKM